MQQMSANDFLPATAGGRPYGDNGGEDDFDVARFSAIRKEQKDELERLDHHYSNTQAAIETQVRGEVDQLFQQFQQGMQQLYTSLTKTVNTTIDNQVQLRLKQERLRREHDAKKGEVEARYHNEASKLIISTSHVGRHPKPPQLPSQGLVPSHVLLPNGTPRSSNFSVTNSGHHTSPAQSSVNRTPPSQQRIPSRSLTSDDTLRERVLQPAPRQEYLVPLPTPMPTPEDLLSHQRRLAPAEPRQSEPRAIEPRPAETRAAPSVDTPPVAHLYAEPRQVEPRPAEPHQVRQQVKRSVSEQRFIEQHQAEPRSVENYRAEQRVEHHLAELDHVEKRLVERSAMDKSVIDHRQVEPRSIEPYSTQAKEPHPVQEEARHLEQQPPAAVSVDQAAEHDSKASTATPSRQESKRKAVEFPIDENANVVLSSKRLRTGDRLTQEELEAHSALDRSSRSTRRSSGAMKETRVKRTIPFQEVYQDGKAQFKHKIFAWPKDSNNWYIVRCDEHQVHFNNGNPIHGAAKHVHSPQHGHMEKRHDLAMEICGHVVLDCNAELAALNNREFERALKEDKYQVFNMNLLTKEGRRRLTDGPVRDVDAPSGPSSSSTPAKKVKTPIKPSSDVIRPEECKFYLGFWAPTKKWYMLIVLPIRPDGSLREVGLKEKLQQTDLMSNVPKCYRSDRVSLRITGWQPAYSDSGAKADKREYPVMFFDSPVQKHSLGWLPAAKLRPVDLSNPPSDADKKGLAMARDWYAMRMMHRKDWEQFKRLGPGEAPSPTSSEGDSEKSEQYASLRSAHTDDMSPIRDKSNGPGHFFGSGSSEEGSDMGDAEDPMTMDIGHIPEQPDSNYVAEDSESESSDVDVEMEAAPGNAAASDMNQDIRSGRRTSTSRPGSRRGVYFEERSWDEEETLREKTTAISRMETAPSDIATPPAEGKNQADLTTLSEQERYRMSAQAKAVAAVKEAASRSRASSETPEVLARPPASPNQQQQLTEAVQARSTFASRPPLAEHSRSGSEDTLTHSRVAITPSSGSTKQNEARNLSDLHSILNKGYRNTEAETAIKTQVNPYQRFEEIRAQMSGLSSRPASALANENKDTELRFASPPQPRQARNPTNSAVQRSPKGSHIMSPPPSQPSAMVPARSSSTTPPQGIQSGRNTPRILIPEGTGRWKAVRSDSKDSVQQQDRAPLVNTSASPKVAPPPPPPAEAPVQPLMHSTPQLGTPIHDKQEMFDVSQFNDSEGINWAREGSHQPLLRLITDPMRKWAETARGSTLRATIEPAQVAWIETDHPKGDQNKQRVSLVTKHNRKVVLMFEIDSADGRAHRAALQGHEFVSWVKRINEKVEWRDYTNSRPRSRRESYIDERQSITVE